MSKERAPIGLYMIVKNEEKYLGGCLDSILPYVKSFYLTDTGSTDKTLEIATKKAKEHGARLEIHHFKWNDNFSDARNFSLKPVREEYALWLDADDIFAGGENLAELIAKMKERKVDAAAFPYWYKIDPITDEPLTIHPKVRISKKGLFEWKAALHEDLIEIRPTNKVSLTDCIVKHYPSEDREGRALERNARILEKELKGQGKKRDPRTIYMLARCYFEMALRKENEELRVKTTKLLEEYLEKSGWNEERCKAWDYLAELYRTMGFFDEGIQASLHGLKEDPRFPFTYITLGVLYAEKEAWDQALFWTTLGLNLKVPETSIPLTPRNWQLRALNTTHKAALGKGKIDQAWAAAEKLATYMPENEEIQKQVLRLNDLRKQKKVFKGFTHIARYLKERGEEDKILPLLSGTPTNMLDNPLLLSIRNQYQEPKRWGKDEVVIYCGQAYEEWSPKSIETGIGGSEEAVIYLSRELARLGLKVTVYGNPGVQAGEYDGVEYKNFWEFNQKDWFNVLVAWRNIKIFDEPILAKKWYLWLHDVPNPADFSEERVKKITKIFPLSEFHRSLLPDVPDEKMMVSANGVEMSQFEGEAERSSNRLIYMSSYDRGLEHLLDMWPEIRKKVPDATLHVFYGWKTFDKIFRDNPERMAWKQKMIKKMVQKGIAEHGRIGHKEIAKEILKSAIWAYPTHFPEISCIGAMKAQIAGAIPVVIDYAALKETTQHGIKLEGDIYDEKTRKKYVQELTSLIKSGKRQEEIREEMIPWAKKEFAWSQVAKQWAEEFGWKKDGKKKK